MTPKSAATLSASVRQKHPESGIEPTSYGEVWTALPTCYSRYASSWGAGWLYAVHNPLFCRVLKGGRLVRTRLDETSVRSILRSRAQAAGVADFSPHDLRRTYISNLLDAGADISTVQKRAGHASVTITQRYDRHSQVSKHAAADLAVPEV